MEHIERLLEQLDALRASLQNDPTNAALQNQLSSLMESIRAQQENPEFYQIQRTNPMNVAAPSPPDTNTSLSSSINNAGCDSGAEYYDASDEPTNDVSQHELDDRFPFTARSVVVEQPPTIGDEQPMKADENQMTSLSVENATVYSASASADDAPKTPTADGGAAHIEVVDNIQPLSAIGNMLLLSDSGQRSQSTSRIDLISSTTTTTLSCSPPRLPPPPPPAPPVLLQKRAVNNNNNNTERGPSPLAVSSMSSSIISNNPAAALSPKDPTATSNHVEVVKQTTTTTTTTQQQQAPAAALNKTSSSKTSAHEKRRYSQHARTIAGINLVSPFCNLSLLETHPNHMCLFLFSSAASSSLSDESSNDPPSSVSPSAGTSDLANSLLFYLITAIYRQQTLHTKSESLMQRWAYELYSTFLLPSAPLELKKCLADDLTYRSTLLAHIDDVLAASSSSYDDSDSSTILNSPSSTGGHHPSLSSSTSGSGGGKSGSPSNTEQHTQMLRDVFNEARFRATEHVKLGLTEFNRQQQASTVASGSNSGGDFIQNQCRQLAQYTRLSEDYVLDHILSLEHIAGGGQRSTSIFERFLAVQLDNLTFKQPLVNVNVAAGDVRKALGSSYSTLAKLMFDRKSLPSLIKDSLNLIEQWPPMFAKEKSKLMSKIITTMKKPAVSVQGHQFNPESFHVAAFCDLCQQLLWGVAPQGYQCQLCQMNVHKLCVTTKDTASGVAPAPYIDRCNGGNPTQLSSFNGGSGKKRSVTSSGVHLLGEFATKFPRSTLQQQSLDRSLTPPKTAATLADGGPQQIPLARTAIVAGHPNNNHDQANPFRFDQQQQNNATAGLPFDQSGTTTVTTTSLPPQERIKSNSFSVSCSTVTAHHKNVTVEAEPTVEPLVNNSSFLDLHTSDIELEPEPPAWQLRLQQHPAILERLVPRERKRQDVINEFIHTERSHVRNLKVLYQNFYRPMLTQRQMPPHILDLIFANLEEIIELHSALSVALKNKQRMSALIGSISDVLLAKFDGEDGQRLRIAAGTYCQNQSIGLDILRKRQKRDDRLAKFLSEAESNPLCRRLQLRDIIPCEMQRLTRYPLLIEQLLKNTDAQAMSSSGSFELVDLQRALRCSQDLVAYVNQAAEEASNRHRLTEVQRHMNTAPFDSINLPTTRHFHGLNLTEHRLLYEGDLLWYVPSAIEKQGAAASAYATLPLSHSNNNSSENSTAKNLLLLGQYNSKYRALPTRALLLNDILVLLSLDDSSQQQQYGGSIGGGGHTHKSSSGNNKNARRFVLQYPNAPARVNANQHSLLLNVDKILSPVVRLDMVRIINPSAAATAAMTNTSAGFEKRFHFLYKVPSPDGNIKNSKVQFYEFEAPTATLRKSWLDQLQQAVQSYTNASQYESIASHMPARARVSVARPSERKRSRHELVSINEAADHAAGLLSNPSANAPLSRQASGGGSAPPLLSKPSEALSVSNTDRPPSANDSPKPTTPTERGDELRAGPGVSRTGGNLQQQHTATPNQLSPSIIADRLNTPTGDASSIGSESVRTTATTSGSEDLDAVGATDTVAHNATTVLLPSTTNTSAANSANLHDYDADEDIEFLDSDVKELIKPELVSITTPPHCECAQHIVVHQQQHATDTRRPSLVKSLLSPKDNGKLVYTTAAAQPFAALEKIDVINQASTQQLRKAIEQSERLKHLIITTTTAGASVCVVNSPPLVVASDARRRRSSSVAPAGGAQGSRRTSSIPPEHLPLPSTSLSATATPAETENQRQNSHRMSLVPTSPAPAFDPNMKLLPDDGDSRGTAPPTAPATLQQLLDITESLNEQLNTLMTLSTARDAQVRHLRQQCNSMRSSASFPQAYSELSPATLATYERQLPPLQVASELETAAASADDRVRDSATAVTKRSRSPSRATCENVQNIASFSCTATIRRQNGIGSNGLARRLSL